MTREEAPSQPPTRWRTRPWPWPEDATREDRAKRVAKTYRGLLQTFAEGNDSAAVHLRRLDAHFDDLGVHWVQPNRPDLLADIDDDEWWSARDIAHAIDRDRKDIYNWARAGHIEQRAGADGTPEYLVSSVVTYRDSLRARRIQSGRIR